MEQAAISNTTPAPPPGYSADDVVAAPSSQSPSSPATPPPPPPGYSADDVTANLTNNPAMPATTASGGMHDLGQIAKGAGHALASTVGGFLSGNAVSPVGNLGEFGRVAGETLEDNSQNNATNARDRLSQSVGYGGETLAEFLTGDEAFKGLTESEKLIQAGKIMKTIEKSPKMVQALKIGASALKTGARTGAVQGIQTELREASPLAAFEDAAMAGAVGTGMSAITGTAAHVLGKAHDAAEGVKALTEAAGNADTKAEVAKSIGDKLDLSKNQLHADYEHGINQLQSQLRGVTVDAKNNPLQRKAAELLQDNPMPDEDPTARQIKNAGNDKLNTKTKEILTSISRGELPITDEDIAAADRASQPSGIVDANGRATTPEPVEPRGQPRPPYDIKGLVDIRQAIRSLADKYEYGDINSRVLRSLINDIPQKDGGILANPMDATIEHMANTSGNQGAVDAYKELRSDYRSKVNLFDDPVIQNLRDEKVADAARAFVGVVRAGDALPTAGKVPYNINNLRTLIGDDELKAFGKQVFGTIMKDSIKNSRFNPAYFMDTMKKITPETMDSLFNIKDASNGLQELYSDAKAAAQVQHLTRVGVLAPTAAGVGSLVGGHIGAGLGTILGLTVTESGGLKAGRELLDYVANHPAMWATYRGLGKAANSTVAKGAATVGRGIAAQSVSTLRQAMQGTKSSLGGTNPNPNQAEPVYVTPSYKGKVSGMVQPGNVDLSTRPDIKNPDGSHSSVFSMSFGMDNGEVLVPGVGDGKTYPLRQLTTKEALDQYRKTGNNLGTFKTPKDADAYGAKLHEDQEKGNVRK